MQVDLDLIKKELIDTNKYHLEKSIDWFSEEWLKSHNNLLKILDGAKKNLKLKPELENFEFPYDDFSRQSGLYESETALLLSMTVKNDLEKTIKNLKFFCKRDKKNDYMRNQIRNLLSQLGHYCNKKDIAYDVIVSCDPIDFLTLGENHCDYGSCFSDTGSNWKHKYRLACLKDSFVIKILNENKVVVGRCWGFCRKSQVCLSNKYYKNISFGVFENILRQTVKEVFGDFPIENKNKLSKSKKIYVNNGNSMFSKKELKNYIRFSKIPNI